MRLLRPDERPASGYLRSINRQPSGGLINPATAPDTLPNLLLWLKADAITGVADGGAVSSWPDSSGNSKDAAQVTGAIQPTYHLDVINGNPIVRFAGDTMSTPALDAGAPTAMTLYILFSGATNNRVLEYSNEYSAVTGGFTLSKVSSRIFAAHRGNVGTAALDSPMTVEAAPFRIVSCVYDKAKATYEINPWVDGRLTSGTLTESNNTNTFADHPVWLFSSNGANVGGGDLAEVIIYAGAHDIDTRLGIERYLHDKYGLDPYTANIAADGDSLTTGTGSPYDNWTTTLLANLTDKTTFTNYAVSGQTVTQMSADAATEIDSLISSTIDTNICIVWGGSNDILLGQADTELDIAAYCAARQAAGWQVIVCTILDRTDFNAGQDTERATVNAAIVADWSTYADALVDLAANANLSDATNTTYFNADGVHLTAAGYDIVAGLIETALSGLGVT